MVRGALHEAMLSKKQENLITPFVSVEHVIPQACRSQWPPPTEVVGGAAQNETAVERRDRIIHTMGNLTLLTQELTSTCADLFPVGSNPRDAGPRRQHSTTEAHTAVRTRSSIHKIV